MNAIELIKAERERQVSAEGWTPEHDDGHRRGELAGAAACYAMTGRSPRSTVIVAMIERIWPWSRESWKPTPDNQVRNLVKAGALIAAEIDRLQRLENTEVSHAARGKRTKTTEDNAGGVGLH